MSRTFRAFVLLVFVAGCGSSERTAPRNLENACAIVDERPQYLKAMRRTERRYGIPIPVQMATIHQESKFVADARTPFKYVLGVIPMGRQSSAFGYSQALDATWREYQPAVDDLGFRRQVILAEQVFLHGDGGLPVARWGWRPEFAQHPRRAR